MQSSLLVFARSLKQEFVEVFSVLASSTVNSKPEEGIMTDSVGFVSLLVV